MILDKLAKLGPREKIGVAVAGLIVLALLMDRLVVATVLGVCREIDTAIVEEEANLAGVKKVLQHREQVVDAYRDVSEAMGETAPAGEIMDVIREAVDQIAARTGVQLLSTEQREPRTSDYFEEHILESRFEADMNSLLSFLYELRQSPAMLRVTQLALSPDKATDLIQGSVVVSKVVVPKVALDE